MASRPAPQPPTGSPGFAVSVGERQCGVGSIASPVFGLPREVLGAISVASPTQGVNPEVIAANRRQVRHAAEQISINLGWCKP
jgi:DNA-binding IclR family transcriptional regulator